MKRKYDIVDLEELFFNNKYGKFDDLVDKIILTKELHRIFKLFLINRMNELIEIHENTILI
jgi:hypothetical protein